MQARELLNDNGKAKDWMVYVKKQDASCEYSVDLPEQSSHPLSIDVQHAVLCGGRVAPRALDASVSFEYDKASGKWVITRFSS